MDGIIYTDTEKSDGVLSAEEYNQLREAVGWAPAPYEMAQTSLRNSAYIAAAKYEGKTVGTARIVSDGGCVAYIADVMVLPEFQRKGIGITIMDMIMNYVRSHTYKGGTVFVSLMAAKGKEPFYSKFGFIARPTEDRGAGMSQFIEG